MAEQAAKARGSVQNLETERSLKVFLRNTIGTVSISAVPELNSISEHMISLHYTIYG